MESAHPKPVSIQDAEFHMFSNRHDLLATITASTADGDNVTPSVTLYDWCAPNSTARVESDLSVQALNLIQGFKHLGTVDVKVETDLSSILSDLRSLPREELFDALLTKLPKQEDGSGTIVQLYTFPVLAKSSSEAFEGQFLQWKWAKPTSPYPPKSGWWEKTLHEALKNGEFNGGKDLQILLRAVSKEEHDERDRKVVHST